MEIKMSDLTRNVVTDSDYIVTGDGIFDDMMEAINTHVKAQYDAGRISGSDYAAVYLGAIQTAIAQSVEILLKKDEIKSQVELLEAQKLGVDKDTEMKEAQKLGIDKDTEMKEAQKELIDEQKAMEIAKKNEVHADAEARRNVQNEQAQLYARQRAGFDENKNQKLFEAQLNSWGLMYSSGMMTELPSIISNDELSTLYHSIR